MTNHYLCFNCRDIQNNVCSVVYVEYHLDTGMLELFLGGLNAKDYSLYQCAKSSTCWWWYSGAHTSRKALRNEFAVMVASSPLLNAHMKRSAKASFCRFSILHSPTIGFEISSPIRCVHTLTNGWPLILLSSRASPAVGVTHILYPTPPRSSLRLFAFRPSQFPQCVENFTRPTEFTPSSLTR